MSRLLKLGVVVTVVCALAGSAFAQGLEQKIEKGISWLITKQKTDGSYSPQLPQPGTTALVEIAFLDSPLEYSGPFVKNGYNYIDGHVQSKGGLYINGKGRFSYNTSLALIAYLARGKEDDNKKIEWAKQYLLNMQFNEEDGPITDENWMFGGWGYDQETLAPDPDIITTYWAIEASKRADVGEGSPLWKYAATFVSRCKSEKEGGFTTGPGFSVVGGSRSRGNVAAKPYGSATGAGVATLLLCGAKQTDPDVVSGIEWIGNNFTTKKNPNLGYQETYLYYYLMARALQLNGEKEIAGRDGDAVKWAEDLSAYLTSIQDADGHWTNETAVRFVKKDDAPEADDVLSTTYAIMALSICNDVLK